MKSLPPPRASQEQPKPQVKIPDSPSLSMGSPSGPAPSRVRHDNVGKLPQTGALAGGAHLPDGNRLLGGWSQDSGQTSRLKRVCLSLLQPSGLGPTAGPPRARTPTRTSPCAPPRARLRGPGSCARTWNWPPEPRYAREERGVGGALRRAGLRGGRGQRWSALPTRGGGVANALELEPPSARYGNCICGLRNLQTLSLLTNQLLDLYDSATM